MYNALGAIKAAPLPGLHALSGADITGQFAGKIYIVFGEFTQCQSQM